MADISIGGTTSAQLAQNLDPTTEHAEQPQPQSSLDMVRQAPSSLDGLRPGQAAGSNDPQRAAYKDPGFSWHRHMTGEGESLKTIAEHDHLTANQKVALQNANPGLAWDQSIQPKYPIDVPAQLPGNPVPAGSVDPFAPPGLPANSPMPRGPFP